MKYIQKYKFWLMLAALLVLAVSFLGLTLRSAAKHKLLARYTLPPSSQCSAGGGVALSTMFELSPRLFGYSYTLENSEHKIVKGLISFTGDIHELSTERIVCALQ
jgi:hypothetical protein